MKDSRILLKNVRNAGLFALALFHAPGSSVRGRPYRATQVTIDELLSTRGRSALVGLRRVIRRGVDALGNAGLPLFTIIRGTSEYPSSVLMWRAGVSVVVDLRQRLYDHVLNSRASSSATIRQMNYYPQSASFLCRTSVSTRSRHPAYLHPLLGLALVLNWRLTRSSVVGPIVTFSPKFAGSFVGSLTHSGRHGTF
jgi:hypothetical protein